MGRGDGSEGQRIRTRGEKGNAGKDRIPVVLRSKKVTKFGPWGGPGGEYRDVQVAPYRLVRLNIHSGETVDGLSFTYIGIDGLVYNMGHWGSRGGAPHEIHLGLMDYVMEISGTTGAYNNMPNVLRSLKITTSRRTYGPYGDHMAGNPFSFSVDGSDRITGFFLRTGYFTDAIGVYVRHC
uniref:Jacalin-type lectin domain-containing protein n=1 Tax=Oryza punctata TaxID=4537 RepID=A0A0E0KNP1_ORYPU